jgi:hypothetical protein
MCMFGWLGAAAGSTAAIWEGWRKARAPLMTTMKKLLHDLRDSKETKLVLILAVALALSATRGSSC